MLAKGTEPRICVRCVMDTSDPWIVFDENGYCNHCTNYFRRAANELLEPKERSLRLQAILAKVKRLRSEAHTSELQSRSDLV